MARIGEPVSLLRDRKDRERGRVTFVELFFDLVFVFAVTQISHALLERFTPLGALQYGLVLLTVWWIWAYTTWVTNWFDPAQLPVRLLLFAMMLAGLLLSSSIPHAFDAHGLVFGLAVVAMQVGRTGLVLWWLRSEREGLRRTFQGILVWFMFAAIFWIAGGLVEGQTRLLLWLVALAIDYTAPWAYYWVPGLGRSTTTDWDVEGAHMAERCGLFMIIALGESIVVIGATFAGLKWTAPVVVAFVASFLSSVAMWWIYFDTTAEKGTEVISTSGDPGRIARLGYTYLPILMVAGIILSAVADEFVLAHPTGHTEPKILVALFGAPIVFLLGTILFARAVSGKIPIAQVAGIALLALLAFFGANFSAAALSAGASALLVIVAAWETRWESGGR